MAQIGISGTLSGTVTEDSTFDADGAALISGQGEAVGVFNSGVFAGMYGALTVTATGAWNYTLDNSLDTVQSLAANTVSHDYFGISWGYGLAQGLIDIVVQGVNDPAVIGGDLAANLNVISAASVSGQIEIYDIDIGEKAFRTVVPTGKFGTLTLNRDGAWQYDLLPGQQTAIQDESKNGVDTFAISSVDGTLASVTILISSGTGTLTGTAGNDTLTSGAGNDSIDGGAGLDTAVFTGTRSSHSVTQTSSGWTVSSGSDGTDTLTGIERLQFSDQTLALDIDGVAGQAYRVYQAAFNRIPDNAGLKYWIGVMDHGESLHNVAAGFINSAEFRAIYGSNPSNEQFVINLYSYVMHRPLDQAGYDFWVGDLNANRISQIDTLVQFSESGENQLNVIGVIQNGIELFV